MSKQQRQGFLKSSAATPVHTILLVCSLPCTHTYKHTYMQT